MAYNEFKTASQVNYGWNLTWESTGKFPIIAKRAFETLADAQGYVDDATSSACEGLILSVFNDDKNNGIYLVQSVGDGTNAGVLIPAGQGTGSVTSTNYEEAIAQATKDNVGQIIYVTEEQTIGDVVYSAGPYIVTGEGTISKLGTTSASGDLAGDVETLKGDVADLDADIQAVNEKVDAIDLTPYAKTEDVNTALEGKVSTEGYVAYSQTEKDKLATIEEGAQVNIIEKVIFNGEEVKVDAQTKSVTLTTPLDVVRGLADGEKVLSLDEASGKLGTTLGLTYYTDTTGETPVYEIRLTGKNNQVLSTIDAKDFVKDGMLDSVVLVDNPADQAEGTYLVFTWNTEAGVTEPMYVPVTDLVDVYTAGDGVDITGKVVKAKVKASDPYLELTTEGIASKGIDNAITVAKNAVVGATTDTEDTVTLYGVKKYASNLVSAHETAVGEVLATKVGAETYNTFVENTNNSISAIKVTDVNTEASNGVALTKSDIGVIGISVTAADLGASLVGATGEVGPVSGVSVKLGQAITDGAEENPTEIISATTSVHAAIQTLAGQIQAAVAGGITSIDGGEYITVGGTATAKTLAVNVAKIGTYMVDNSSALKVDSSTGKLSLEWEIIQ